LSLSFTWVSSLFLFQVRGFILATIVFLSPLLFWTLAALPPVFNLLSSNCSLISDVGVSYNCCQNLVISIPTVYSGCLCQVCLCQVCRFFRFCFFQFRSVVLRLSCVLCSSSKASQFSLQPLDGISVCIWVLLLSPPPALTSIAFE